jgi:hypothetical protein
VTPSGASWFGNGSAIRYGDIGRRVRQGVALMKRFRAFIVAVGMLLGMVGYRRIVRPWYLRWGATDEEVARAMPLDDRVPNPCLTSTMAITIGAPPERIWPWLTQMGEGERAGYYSFEPVERALGLEVENSWRILPEYQQLAVGEAIDRAGTMTVLAVEPNRHLVLGPPTSEPVAASWAFGLYLIDAQRTRLVTRVHGSWSWSRMLRETPVSTWPFYLLLEPGAFVMEWQMLRGIKARAESPVQGPGQVTAP